MKKVLGALLALLIAVGAAPFACAANVSRIDAAVYEIAGLVLSLTDVMPGYSRGPYSLEPALTVYTLYFGNEGTTRFSRSVELVLYDDGTLVQTAVTVEAGETVAVSEISGGRLYFDDPASGFVCFLCETDALRFPGAAAADLDINALDASREPPPQIERIEAIPTPQKVLVSGREAAFDAYNIGGSNYFKLRDMAFALSGTEKTFEVVWNGETRAIHITKGIAYTPDGTEMAPRGNVPQIAVTSDATVYIDGVKAEFEVYNIKDNNYFKLRDLGDALGFSVRYDEGTNTVFIDADFAD
ncbi:MAG TPA: hypothetical protein GXZ77_07575 [Papillibacter sp.]|nr:hypothetical protein [Papillibacter sp.]